MAKMTLPPVTAPQQLEKNVIWEPAHPYEETLHQHKLRMLLTQVAHEMYKA